MKTSARKIKVPRSSPVLLQPLEDPIDLREMMTFRLLRIAAKLTQGFIKSYTSQFEIGLPEWRTLGMLGHFGPLPSIRIAELAEMDRGSISRAVAWLEQRDLVRRMDEPGHQRRKIVAMTVAGKRLHDRICAHAKARQKRILDLLAPEEQAVLNQVIGKLDGWASELHSSAATPAVKADRTSSRVRIGAPATLDEPLVAHSRAKLLEQLAQFKRAIETYA